MAYKGGFLWGEIFTKANQPNTEYRHCIVYGTVCKDAKVFRYKTKKAKHSMKVDVLMKYDDGEGGYVSVWSFQDNYISQQLSLMKKNDKAVIFGTLVKRTRYEEGEELPIVHAYIDPAFVISNELVRTIDVLVASDKFQNMVADEFSSADDFEPQEEEEQKQEPKKETNETDYGFV